jgi:glycine betaine/choline ABC-type transport system substrate-binding protein
MRKIVFTLVMLLVLKEGVEACVGKVLTIGAVSAPHDRVLAELISVLINERTGTTVSVRFFNTAKELYAAVEKNEVAILIENTERGTEVLGRSGSEQGEKAYAVLKEEFRKRYNLVWLQPVGAPSLDGGIGRTLYSPALTVEVMNNFPALPRVINKLAGVMNDEGYGKMARSVESGEKPSKAARDFLKSKKFI